MPVVRFWQRGGVVVLALLHAPSEAGVRSSKPMSYKTDHFVNSVGSKLILVSYIPDTYTVLTSLLKFLEEKTVHC